MSDNGENSRKGEDRNLPSAKEVRQGLTINWEVSKALEQRFKRGFFLRSTKSEIQYAHLKGVKDHYQHKMLWSWFLMFVVFGLVAFQIILLVMVGSGKWDFREYPYLIPALLVQNFAAVVGLATFVVRSLFNPFKGNDTSDSE